MSAVFAGEVITAPVASVVVVVAGLLPPKIFVITNCMPKKMTRPCTADLTNGYEDMLALCANKRQEGIHSFRHLVQQLLLLEELRQTW